MASKRLFIEIAHYLVQLNYAFCKTHLWLAQNICTRSAHAAVGLVSADALLKKALSVRRKKAGKFLHYGGMEETVELGREDGGVVGLGRVDGGVVEPGRGDDRVVELGCGDGGVVEPGRGDGRVVELGCGDGGVELEGGEDGAWRGGREEEQDG